MKLSGVEMFYIVAETATRREGFSPILLALSNNTPTGIALAVFHTGSCTDKNT